MEKQQAEALLEKYLAGTCTPGEKKLVERAYNLLEQETPEMGAEPDYDHWKSVIYANIHRGKTNRLWPKIGYAAAVATIIMSTGIWFYQRDKKEVITVQANYVHDIAPGKNAATLTLANGRKILIDDASAGAIATQTGIRISKTKDGQIIYEVLGNNSGTLEYNTLSTSQGEQTQVRLPDGSFVWLNAASSLRYPASFSRLKERKVELSGEGYFEIAKDKAHPFIVESGNQKVEVLGTHFNVSAYQDEKVFRTTLLEGSVRLSENGMESILEPGVQATNVNGRITQAKVDTEFAVAWKNNKFIFDRLPIDEIMRMIARWYNVKIVYENEIPTGTFWGSVSRFENVSKALIPLEATGNVHFRIEGRTIYVAK